MQSNLREVTVSFAELAELAESLAVEASKLKKRAAIAAAVRRAAAENASEAGRFCLYLAGQPFAEADPRKLNTGGAILSRVLKQIAEASDAALNIAYRKHGDLGAAAFDLLSASGPTKRSNPDSGRYCRCLRRDGASANDGCPLGCG